MGGFQTMASLTGAKHLTDGVSDLVSGQYRQGAKNLAESSVRLSLSLLAVGILLDANHRSNVRDYSLKMEPVLFKTSLEKAESFCYNVRQFRIEKSFSDITYIHTYPDAECLKDFFATPQKTFDILIEQQNFPQMAKTVDKIARYCHLTLERQIAPTEFSNLEKSNRSKAYVSCVKNILNNDSQLLHRLT